MNIQWRTVCAIALFSPMLLLADFRSDAGMFKDVLLWYNGAVDADGDGSLSSEAGTELRDAFHANDAIHALSQGRQETAEGNEAAIQIVRDRVTSTVGGLNIENVVCLRGVHSPKADGKFQPARVYLGNVAPFTFSYANSYTIVTRFKWFGYLGAADYTVMGSLGYAWGTPIGSGLRFGFHGAQNDVGKANVWLSFGGADKSLTSWFAGTNKWTNMAIVMNGVERKATVYMENSNNGEISTSVVDYPAAINESTYEPGSGVYVLGDAALAEATDAKNRLYGFNGEMHHFGVWGKVMSLDDVKKAFRWPNKSVNWQVGFDDGSSHEFGGLSPESSFECRADSEIGFPETMSASGRSEMNIIFPFDVSHSLDAPAFPSRNQIVICKSAPTSDHGRISASVNGISVGESSIGSGGSAAFLLPSGILRDSNVLTLKITSGTVTFDTIYGGGDWQVGLCNDSCFNDGFTAAYYPEYVIGTSWSLFTRILSGPGNGSRKSIDIKFPLSAEQVNKFKWSFEVRWRKHAGNPVDIVKVNGVKVGECDFYGWDFHATKVNVNPNLLFPGLNTISLERETTTDMTNSDYDEIDYVRLQPERLRYKSMVVIVK